MTHLQSTPGSVSDFFAGAAQGPLTTIDSEIDYRALFQQTPRSLILFDLEGHVLAVNPAYTLFWGLTAEQIPADYNILHDSQLKANGFLPLIRLAFDGEVSQLPPMQYDVGSLTGNADSSRWFLGVVYPVKDIAGSIQFIAMIHTDVTLQIEEKLASDALARREALRMQDILASTADGVVMVDREWRFTYANERARELISNGTEIIGVDIREAYSQVSHTTLQRLRTTMIDRVSVDFQAFYPQPIDRWFRLRAFPTEDGISIFFQDCTEQRLAETSVRENERFAVAGRLAASIAHEINNPLESITNLLYLLEIEETQSPASRRFISLAQQELRRVAHITVNTLQYFRPAALSTITSMQEVADSVLTMFQGRIRQGGVHVTTHFLSHAPLQCIASELRQVCANFLGNALDATPCDGRIAIRSRPAHHPRSGEAGLLLTIADTGCGMSRDTLAHLYEAFYTTKGAGTGIGLWVSYDLIRKHRGEVKVRSRQSVGQRDNRSGTVFEIFFPFDNGLTAAAGSMQATLSSAVKLSALTSQVSSHPNG